MPYGKFPNLGSLLKKKAYKAGQPENDELMNGLSYLGVNEMFFLGLVKIHHNHDRFEGL